MMQRYIMLIAGVLVLLLSACGVPTASSGTTANSKEIQVQAAWARPVTVADSVATPDMHGDHGSMAATDTAMSDMSTGSGVTGAAYMTIINNGSAPDQLVKVTTDVAEAVEIHNTTTDNNVAQMRSVSSVDVAAHGSVGFKPGGYHMMLINVKRTLQPGDTVPLTLTFQHAGDVQVAAEVRSS